jgi:hypothetical protein
MSFEDISLISNNMSSTSNNLYDYKTRYYLVGLEKYEVR